MKDDADGICDNCCAPKEPGLATCKFCGRPFVADLAARAVPCPQCKTYNDWGVTKCVRCDAWVVVKCLFCGCLSPHHMPACLRCKEPFAGAPERFAAKQAAAQQAQTLQTVATVGTVAATVLGAAAASGIGRRGLVSGGGIAADLIGKGIADLLDDD